MKSKLILYILAIPLIVILLIWGIRATNPTQIDALHPLIGCTQEELDKADIFYIVPYYKNSAIAENKKWCQEIKATNKTFRLHGYTHTFEEFSSNKTQEEIIHAIQIFKDCIGVTPTRFKAPQLAINKDNIKILTKNNLKIDKYTNQLLHKVYHCNDS
ncbi:MAG: putative deacetylase, partial [Patescibacteria group bacterium]